MWLNFLKLKNFWLQIFVSLIMKLLFPHYENSWKCMTSHMIFVPLFPICQYWGQILPILWCQFHPKPHKILWVIMKNIFACKREKVSLNFYEGLALWIMNRLLFFFQTTRNLLTILHQWGFKFWKWLIYLEMNFNQIGEFSERPAILKVY